MPARLRDLKRALEGLGISVLEPGAGSHWKLSRPGAPSYPLPAHNGLKTEITDIYLKAMCRHFGLDLAELKKLL